MEDIYQLCDKIIENKVLTIDALKITLSGIAKGNRFRYRRNTDKFYSRAQSMNYRAKKIGVNGCVTPAQLAELYNKSGKCANCGSKDNLTFDHIVPLYRKGENTIKNLQLLCAKCNMEKGVS